MGRNSGSNAAVKLFVAGIPSGISQESVADFFSRYGDLKLDPESLNLGEPRVGHQSKGHCILLCADVTLADRLIAQKSFRFLGRSLSVSHHKSGIGLIVQNKRLNKCRVIFKKVPSYFSEEDFQMELTSRCGALQALFQFKPVNPTQSRPKTLLHLQPKYHVYSAVFTCKSVAKQLIDNGYLELSDGSRVLTEKFQRPQAKKIEADLAYPQNTSSPNKIKDNALVRNNWSESKPTTKASKTINDSSWKPSSKHYFTVLRTATGKITYNYDHDHCNLRINLKKPKARSSNHLLTAGSVYFN